MCRVGQRWSCGEELSPRALACRIVPSRKREVFVLFRPSKMDEAHPMRRAVCLTPVPPTCDCSPALREELCWGFRPKLTCWRDLVVLRVGQSCSVQAFSCWDEAHHLTEGILLESPATCMPVSFKTTLTETSRITVGQISEHCGSAKLTYKINHLY